MGEQRRELAALRQNEAAMRAHVCALLETVAYVEALFAGQFEGFFLQFLWFFLFMFFL